MLQVILDRVVLEIYLCRNLVNYHAEDVFLVGVLHVQLGHLNDEGDVVRRKVDRTLLPLCIVVLKDKVGFEDHVPS